MRLFALLSAIASVSLAAREIPTSFDEYRNWIDNASWEEKREHFESLSENYIKENGEDANEMRLCITLEQNWMGLDNWVDQKWRSVGVRELDLARYTDWIVKAEKTARPWIVMFASTPKRMGPVVQPSDNMMRNLSCMARVFGDRINFGFMDYRDGEKVFENYDVKLDWGKTTPALIAFDKGYAYPAKPSTLNAIKLSQFATNFTEECQHCRQRIKAPQSELTLYLEYAKNEVANSHLYINSYNYMYDNYNDTWIHQEVLFPYFGPKVGKKRIGERLIFWVIVPVVLNSLVVLYLTLSCMCGLCCGKGSEEGRSDKVTVEDAVHKKTDGDADEKKVEKDKKKEGEKTQKPKDDAGQSAKNNTQENKSEKSSKKRNRKKGKQD